MLDSRVCALPTFPASPIMNGGMSSVLLGELPLLERLERLDRAGGVGPGFGLGLGPPPGFRPLPPRLWRPTVWGSPPPPPSPCRLPPHPHPPPLLPPSLPVPGLCPEPSCHGVPSFAAAGAGVAGVTHLFDYVASARLWYPWYYKGESSILGTTSTCPAALDSSSYDLAAASAAAAAAAAQAASASVPASAKELPTRGLKSERLKERQELSQVLHLDKEHAASLCAARKTVSTASTQTQFSSFNGEAPPYPGPPPGPPPAYFAPRGAGDEHPRDSYPHHHHPVYGPPPPLPHPSSMSSSSPPSSSSHLVDLSHTRMVASSSDVQNAPLNLSLSNSPLLPVTLSSSSSSSVAAASSSSSAWQPHRSSVITCMSSSSSPVSSGGSSPHGHSHNGHHGGNNGRASPSGNSHPVSDPAIEEHFRRSLASYGDSVPKTTASSSAALESNVSITGSVDDHFAKALGDSTWKALKSQSDAEAPEIFTGSVDDHFAKALGATTWRRIKAETEHSESSLSSGAANSGNTITTLTTTTPSNTANANHSPGHSSSSSSPSHSSSSLSAPAPVVT